MKALVTGQKKPVVIDSGPQMTRRKMLEALREAAPHWHYEVVSIGYPGNVVRNEPAEEAPNLGKGWVGFDFNQNATGRGGWGQFQGVRGRLSALASQLQQKN